MFVGVYFTVLYFHKHIHVVSFDMYKHLNLRCFALFHIWKWYLVLSLYGSVLENQQWACILGNNDLSRDMRFPTKW